MHVFLTGDRRVGKSRAVKRVTEMTSRPIKGFLTRFLTSERGSSSLYMLPAERPDSFDPEHMVACLTDGSQGGAGKVGGAHEYDPHSSASRASSRALTSSSLSHL